MLDFVSICLDDTSSKKFVNIFPDFIHDEYKDLMIRGGDFYAAWDEGRGVWTTNLYKLVKNIDLELEKKYNEVKDRYPDCIINVKYLKNDRTDSFTRLLKYFKKCPDNYKVLNQKIIFYDDPPKREDYSSIRVGYTPTDSPIPNYDELMSVLYSPEEREKIEWAIGSILSGESKRLQKFFVFYGGPGTGKSTVIHIIEKLFDGYYITFDAKALGDRNDMFAMEPFSRNPLIAIQHDGDLSRIEDNTRLNSLVAHELMIINEKFKKRYTERFLTTLFIGTNKPVRITDAKSGILRRLVDINPTGNIVPSSRYYSIMDAIDFELGGIAKHCLDVYKEQGGSYYDTYKPLAMMSITNDFYNFIDDNYEFFMENRDRVLLTPCWKRYEQYLEEANIPNGLSRKKFKEELKNYFETYKDRTSTERNIYIGFKEDSIRNLFRYGEKHKEDDNYIPEWLKLEESEKSLLDKELSECIAQYTTASETPKKKWSEVTTKLSEIDTGILHYVKPPANHIVIDFDIKDENNNKDYILNLKAAKSFPPTYAEVSKGGNGLHLHYIYNGDIERLAALYDKDIEIKVFKEGSGSALRRKVSKCNDYPVATITGGLPLKEERKVLSEKTINDERHLRNLIAKALKKEIHQNTKPSIDFINQLLEEAYASGIVYDVSDLFPEIQAFANNSTNQAVMCLEIVSQMKFKSEAENENDDTLYVEDEIIFFDIEVFPNLLLVCWKRPGDHDCVQMFNPSPEDVETLCKRRLVGFNNRKYDNHILYARMMGYNNKAMFELSSRIVSGKDKDILFREAYNLSYTDIYDFLSSANKMSLKKWEIKLGIHHLELGLPWDEDLPEDKWALAAEYCCNDVIATEAVWNANQGDWTARQILAELSGLTVNDTTNQHTTRIILDGNKNAQKEFVYTDLSIIFPGYEFNEFGFPPEKYDPGIKPTKAKSYYRGEDPSEGGYVYAEPGIWENVVVLDIASMHPHAGKALNIFGKYTKNWYDMVDARVKIKHGDYEAAGEMFDGKLKPYLTDETTAKQLSNALKTALNSVYGLTSATFPNALRDDRNKDNIIAKYGALFMINLKHEVQDRGFVVAHIKTDSIKIVNPTDEIISFVMDYGKQYGYTFENEATYSKMCLINDSTFIAKVVVEDGKKIEPYWKAVGKEFQVPYIFKTLFTHEPIEFEDLCETKSVTTAQLYLNMVNHMDEPENLHFVGKVGLFTPIKPGCGGGILLRKDDKTGKLQAVEGTKLPGKIPKGENDRYFWLEAEAVLALDKQDDIDYDYWDHAVQSAKDKISKFGNFDEFVSDGPMTVELPWEDDPREEVPYEDYISKVEAKERSKVA